MNLDLLSTHNSVSGDSFYHVAVEAEGEKQVQVYGDMYFYMTETQPVFDEPRIA